MKGYIYEINVNECTYIGSTRNIKKRKSAHNCLLRKKYCNKLYNYCYLHGIESLNLKILEYDEFDNLELRKREQFYINQIDSNKLLNKNKAYITELDRKLYKQTIICPCCGTSIRRDVFARHRSSNKHKKNNIVII